MPELPREFQDFTVSYLDDRAIFSDISEDHLNPWSLILDRNDKANLKSNSQNEAIEVRVCAKLFQEYCGNRYKG